MTVQEIYEWRLHRGIENLDLVYDNINGCYFKPTIVKIVHDEEDNPIIKLECN